MVDLMVTYLEMTSPPKGPSLVPPPGVAMRREAVGPDDYLALYRRVGAPWQWDQRLRLQRLEVERLLSNPATHIHILRLNGEAMGFCEFFGVGEAEIELVHFGIVPEAQGLGLGKCFLNSALRDCWSMSPRRIWLHTDTNDHPRALSVYEKAGFRRYMSRMETFPD